MRKISHSFPWTKTFYIAKETLNTQGFLILRKMGLEPTQPESYKILSLARLPVPTLPQVCGMLQPTKDIILFFAEIVNIFF